jgi:hypothetical protein
LLDCGDEVADAGMIPSETISRTVCRQLTVRPVRYKVLVIKPETMQSVRALRARGLSPQEIARSLRMRPAAVAELVRKLAAEQVATNPGGVKLITARRL